MVKGEAGLQFSILKFEENKSLDNFKIYFFITDLYKFSILST